VDGLWVASCDNRGGAGGTTRAAAVANAKPDGYTLLLSVNSALTTNRYLQKNFPFDPKTAFAPITLTSDVALVLAVHPSLPVHDVTGLIEYATKNPGKLAYVPDCQTRPRSTRPFPASSTLVGMACLRLLERRRPSSTSSMRRRSRR
jgi:hypothetical protein